MRTLILDGAAESDPLAPRVTGAIMTALTARRWDAEHVVLRDQKIGNCAGDFFCWIRTPGVCNVDDDNRWIAQATVQSDLIVYMTRVTFGGYSSGLKRMVDHQIQIISPFFTTIDREVHHQRRYARYPSVLVAGWMDAPNPRQEAIFHHLAHRNAINMHAPAVASGIAYAAQADGELVGATTGWLAELERDACSPKPGRPQLPASADSGRPVRRAMLLVGSPRGKTSTSASLGGYLIEQLGARGIETEVAYLYTTLSRPDRLDAMLDSIDRADLIVLSFPLYVDSLPAPVIRTLETIAARRAGAGNSPGWTAITNCGFPEARHCDTALAICAAFADQAGFGWAGGLALGGGEGLVHGAPLAELGGRAIPIRKALDMAADALSAGGPIPAAAGALLAAPVIPPWMYRLAGGIGWRRQARRYGAQHRLRARPYARA